MKIYLDLGNQTSKLAINQSIPAAVSGVIPLGNILC